MAVLPPIELIQAARAQGGEDALRNLPPVVVSASLLPGFDPQNPATLLQPSMVVTPVVHPLLAAQIEVTGATRIGSATWSVGLGGREPNISPLGRMLDAVAPGTVVTERMSFTQKGPRDLKGLNDYGKANDVEGLLMGTAAAAVLTDRRRAALRQSYPRHGAASFGAVTLAITGRVLYMRVITHFLEIPEEETTVPRVKLNLLPAGRSRIEPKALRPAEAVAVLEWAARAGLTVVDPSRPEQDVAVLRRRLSESLVAWPAPGRPAEAQVTIGRNVHAEALKVTSEFDKPGPGRATSSKRVTAQTIAEIAAKLDPSRVVLHPAIADVARLAVAEPVDDPRLRVYQREAVGLHVATTLGYVNACAPGMGKTIMTLEGMRRRAANRLGWRGLVVAEANVRVQWAGEARVWFPEAQVVTIDSRAQAATLAEALADAGDAPLLVITSYAMLRPVKEILDQAEARVDEEIDDARPARTVPLTLGKTAAEQPVLSAELVTALADAKQKSGKKVSEWQLDLFDLFTSEAVADEAFGEAPATVDEVTEVTAVDDVDQQPEQHLGQLLLDVPWHDIIADEADVLRGVGSKQSQALWALRENSEVAIALTGTPVDRSLDDLGRLISWARNDRDLFTGVRLDTQFDLSNKRQLAEYAKALGPLVFRRDDSELADELPRIDPVVMRLEPTIAERNLASAARNELKRVYEELMSWLRMVEATDPRNDAYAQAREQLTAARGAWLGGTTLARMASSDPAALLGSASAGAALLAGQGLVAAATAQTGTKRAAVVADTRKRVANGEKVLIFTGFATVATGLIDDLAEAGVAVGGVLGGEGRKRDRQIAAFQNGQLDVLVCTSSGERGLNLQQATTVVHYDLPWTPKGVIQRTGRAKRIGAVASRLTVVFPIMVGTIEERVASLVVARAVTAMRALDASRGVDTANSEMGVVLGGLVAAVTNTELKKGEAAMLEMTRELLAA